MSHSLCLPFQVLHTISVVIIRDVVSHPRPRYRVYLPRPACQFVVYHKMLTSVARSLLVVVYLTTLSLSTTDEQWTRKCKEAVVAWLKKLSWNLPEGTEKKHKKKSASVWDEVWCWDFPFRKQERYPLGCDVPFRRAIHVGVPLLNMTLLGPQKAVTYNNGYSPEGLRVSLTQTSFPYIAGTWNISQKTAATYNNDHKP